MKGMLARPTPPRPAKSKPCPALQKLTKPAGCDVAKLTADSTIKTQMRKKKKQKLMLWPCVQLVLIILFAERSLKLLYAIFSCMKTQKGNILQISQQKQFTHFWQIFGSEDLRVFLPRLADSRPGPAPHQPYDLTYDVHCYRN